jgi:CRP/FNR family transcriptional regulator
MRAARPTPRDRIDALALTYLFRGLPDDALASIAEVADVLQLDKGQRLFSVGDPVDGIHVVVAGSIKESVVAADGGELVFEVFTRGAVEGEPGTFSFERTRMVDLIAVEDATLLRISRQSLLDIGWSNHLVIERLMAGLSQQIRQAIDDQAALAFRRVRDRIAMKLIDLTATHGTDAGPRRRIELRISQATLAAMAGTSREHANRALRALSDEGSVEIVGGRLVVDREALLRTLGQDRAAEQRNDPTRRMGV